MNEGVTPAYNLKTAIKATILNFPVEEMFNFELPEANVQNNPAVGPRQYRDITGLVADYVPDQDVAGIKDLSSGKALFVWGKVTYDDAFGTGHFANFAQILYSEANGTVMGVYEKRHNDSD